MKFCLYCSDFYKCLQSYLPKQAIMWCTTLILSYLGIPSNRQHNNDKLAPNSLIIIVWPLVMSCRIWFANGWIVGGALRRIQSHTFPSFKTYTLTSLYVYDAHVKSIIVSTVHRRLITNARELSDKKPSNSTWQKGWALQPPRSMNTTYDTATNTVCC